MQDTGPIREHDGRGRHTTTSRSLHLLPGGACIIDTPGVRTLRPDADERTVASSFAEVDALAARCRFRDCRHAHEPGCAVREEVDPDRLRNYHKLLAAFKGMKLTSPRGPIMIDSETRDIVQTVYIRKVEKKDGKLANIEFDRIPDVKDPGK